MASRIVSECIKLRDFVLSLKRITKKERARLIATLDRIQESRAGEGIEEFTEYVVASIYISLRDKKLIQEDLRRIVELSKTEEEEKGEEDGVYSIARLPNSIDTEYFNLSEVAHYISTRGDLADGRNLKIPESAIVTVNLENLQKDVHLSADINVFDLACLDACFTLIKAGTNKFTPDMLWKVMDGNITSRISDERRKEVVASLRKMAAIRITINCTKEWKKRGYTPKEGVTVEFTDYLLPMREISLKSSNSSEGDLINGFSISTPELYRYANTIGKIATIPTEVLTVRGLKSNVNNLLIKRWLIRKIEVLKLSVNKKDARTVIYYDKEGTGTMIQELWYDQTYSNVREQKARLHKTVVRIMDTFKEMSYVSDYRTIFDNRGHVVGIEIIL